MVPWPRVTRPVLLAVQLEKTCGVMSEFTYFNGFDYVGYAVTMF